MPGGYMIITEKDWDKMPPKQQGWLLFNTMQNINKRLKKVERRPFVDKIYSFGGGIIGGAAAYLGIKLS